jgi:hypothetical protein
MQPESLVEHTSSGIISTPMKNAAATKSPPRSKSASSKGAERSPTRKTGEATRERMLDAAEFLFAQHGYHGTSMRDVARESEATLAAKDAPIAVDQLVTGYVWPFVERSSKGGRGWKNYSLLVARASNSPDYSTVIGVHYNPVARQFLAEFCRALPGIEEERVFHAFSFMVGTMLSLVAEPGRLESLSSGKYKSGDLERVFATMRPFLVAGFGAL